MTTPGVGTDTLSTILGVIVWVPLTVWLVSLIQWMVSADVDVLTGVSGIAIGLSLAYLTIRPPMPQLSPVFFTVTWLTVLLYPGLRAAMDKRALIAIDLQALDRAYQAIAAKPDNLGARLKVAKIAYSRGLAGHAIAVVEDSLRNLPENLFTEEYKLLSNWKNAMGARNQARSLPCLECGHPNRPGLLHCERCQAPFLLHHARGKWVGPKLARRATSGIIAVVLVVFGLPAAFRLPFAWQELIVAAAVVVMSGALGYRALAPEKK